MLVISRYVFYANGCIEPRTKDEPKTKWTNFQSKYYMQLAILSQELYTNQKLSAVIFNVSILHSWLY